MNILVLNSGSSSLKYQVFNMKDNSVMAQGVIERIGLKDSIIRYKAKGKKERLIKDIENHKKGLELVIDLLTKGELAVLKTVDEINAIGHRVVHGGENFSESALIDDKVFKAIEECEALAPLHNPANKGGIIACKEMMPNTPQVAVFDTAFHQTMPKSSYLYALPYKYYEKYGVRRYGFHGTSHKYVSQKTAEFLNEDIEGLKMITCHIGNGASITAINGEKVLDTSMGFTPLEGLMMGTRCGDIDPAITSFLMEKENLTPKELDKILNKESGILGVSGISSDLREVIDAAEEGKEKAMITLEMFTNRILKYIGSYVAILEGVDVIVFTAGVGENSFIMREKIVNKLGWLGIELDKKVNDSIVGERGIISTKKSKVKVVVMPTNEEYMIAKDTYDLVK